MTRDTFLFQTIQSIFGCVKKVSDTGIRKKIIQRKKTITYSRKLPTFTWDIHLQPPPPFLEKEFSSLYRISSRFPPLLFPKTLPGFFGSFPRSSVFRRGEWVRLISRIDLTVVCISRKDAHALRIEWHMHCLRATACSTVGSSILRTTFFHKGHSCINPIPNINRRNGLLRRRKRARAQEREREKEKKTATEK